MIRRGRTVWPGRAAACPGRWCPQNRNDAGPRRSDMTDVTTTKPLRVLKDSHPDTEPLIIVPVEQLDRLREILDANGVRYEVDEEYLSVDEGPEVAFVNLHWK